MRHSTILAAIMAAMLWCPAVGAMAQAGQEAPTVRPRNAFKVSGGMSLVTSQVNAPVYQGIYLGTARMKGLQGFDLTSTYEHIWKPGVGIGVDYAYSRSKLKRDLGNFQQHYLGASFVYAYRGWKHFGLEGAVGFGYVHYKEKPNVDAVVGIQGIGNRFPSNYFDYAEDGIGGMMRFGVEYRFNRHIGIGIEASYFLTEFIHDEETLGYNNPYYDYYNSSSKNSIDGIERFNILAGLRFYF